MFIPAKPFQSKRTGIASSFSLSGGNAREGVGNAVAKVHTADQALVPDALEALTLQK